MEQSKFLRYCPNCYNYNKSSGFCSYINSNVLDNPGEFIKYCDGKYLSLIKGKVLKPVKEKKKPEMNTNEELVTVFSSNSNVLFQYAKSILDDNKIEYISSGDYLNSLEGFVYSSQIKVFLKDVKLSLKLLSEVRQTVHEPDDIADKKINSFIGRFGIAIILFLLILMILLLYLLKD